MKTIRETILSYPGIEEGESYLDTVLIDRSLDGAANYSIEESTLVKLAVADIYSMLGALPDFTENKLSITYPRAWYTQKAKELYSENGEHRKANSLGKSIKLPRGKSNKSW